MPAYDQHCKSEVCDWDGEIFAKVGENPPCPKCGGETERWFPIGRARSASVIDDTIIGGLTVENLAPDPITFHSKSEHRRYLKEHGIVQKVRHVGEEGSDKSKHTTRWI